jgi:hypothetical protein
MPEPGVRSRAQASWWSPFPSLVERWEDSIIRLFDVRGRVFGSGERGIDGFIIVVLCRCMFISTS